MAPIFLPHPSQPGFYGERFDAPTRTAVAIVVDTLIPEGDGYPAASQAGVVDYLESRCSPQDVEVLASMCLPAAAADDVEAHLSALELAEPDAFLWLKQFVYHGYYGSNLVIGVLNSKGYDYHGAPQPFGYAIEAEQPIPQAKRGNYIPTQEVRRVP